MQSNFIPAPVFTGIRLENKQLEQTPLSEETGTERCGEESGYEQNSLALSLSWKKQSVNVSVVPLGVFNVFCTRKTSGQSSVLAQTSAATQPQQDSRPGRCSFYSTRKLTETSHY